MSNIELDSEIVSLANLALKNALYYDLGLLVSNYLIW